MAIGNTFQEKQLSVPEKVLPLEPAFGDNQEKQMQWQAFVRKGDLLAPAFPEIITILHDFLSPPLQAIREKKSFEASWPSGGPWRRDIENR